MRAKFLNLSLRQSTGLTLFEVVLVLLVGGIILGAIWLGYSQLTVQDKVSRTITVLDQSIQVARDFISNRSIIPDNLSVQLRNDRVMPMGLVAPRPSGRDPNGEIVAYTSPLGEDFSVERWPANRADQIGPLLWRRDNFFAVFVALPNRNLAPCTSVLAKIVGSDQSLSERRIAGYAVGSEVFIPNPQFTIPTRLKPDEIQTACSAADNDLTLILFAR